MKNVTETQKKTCISIGAKEFEDVLEKIVHPDISVEYSCDRVLVEVGEDTVDTNELYTKLAEYYEVSEVTSIHIDGSDVLGVWIVYKE